MTVNWKERGEVWTLCLWCASELRLSARRSLQELNSKAETKFTKLRMQAKSKIISLTREMEKLKGEVGDEGGRGGDALPSPNTSFDVSVREGDRGSVCVCVCVCGEWINV